MTDNQFLSIDQAVDRSEVSMEQEESLVCSGESLPDTNSLLDDPIDRKKFIDGYLYLGGECLVVCLIPLMGLQLSCLEMEYLLDRIRTHYFTHDVVKYAISDGWDRHSKICKDYIEAWNWLVETAQRISIHMVNNTRNCDQYERQGRYYDIGNAMDFVHRAIFISGRLTLEFRDHCVRLNRETN